MSTRLLTLKQVAERLNQSVKTVRRRIAYRQLQAVQLSKRAWRVEEAELERFVAERSTGTISFTKHPM